MKLETVAVSSVAWQWVLEVTKWKWTRHEWGYVFVNYFTCNLPIYLPLAAAFRNENNTRGQTR